MMKTAMRISLVDRSHLCAFSLLWLASRHFCEAEPQKYVALDLGMFQAYGLSESGIVSGGLLEPDAHLDKPAFYSRDVGFKVFDEYSSGLIRKVNDSGIGVGMAFSHSGSRLTESNASFYFSESIERINLPEYGSEVSYNYINNSNTVVGNQRSGDVNRGFIWSGGSFSIVDGFSSNTSLYRVTNGGTVLGVSQLGDSRDFFTIRNGDYSHLQLSGYRLNTVGDYIDSGEFTGTGFDDAGHLKAFVTDGKTTAFLDAHSLTNLVPQDFNYNGVVVGFGSRTGDRTGNAAFVHFDGATYLLEDLIAANDDNIKLETSFGINDSGIIIANGFSNQGVHRAYMLVPIPEPQTYCVLIGLFAGTYALLRKDRSRSLSRYYTAKSFSNR